MLSVVVVVVDVVCSDGIIASSRPNDLIIYSIATGTMHPSSTETTFEKRDVCPILVNSENIKTLRRSCSLRGGSFSVASDDTRMRLWLIYAVALGGLRGDESLLSDVEGCVGCNVMGCILFVTGVAVTLLLPKITERSGVVEPPDAVRGDAAGELVRKILFQELLPPLELPRLDFTGFEREIVGDAAGVTGGDAVSDFHPLGLLNVLCGDRKVVLIIICFLYSFLLSLF